MQATKVLFLFFYLLLGAGMLCARLSIGDDCEGMPNGIMLIGFAILYFACFLLSILYVKNWWWNLGVNVLILFSISIAKPLEELLRSPVKWQAAQGNKRLVCRKNGRFEMLIPAVEASCTYRGSYRISVDTLYLLRPDLLEITDSLVGNTYQIDKKSGFLLPLSVGDTFKLIKAL